MTQLHYNLVLFSGTLKQIDEITEGKSAKGREWKKRSFSVQSKYDWGRMKTFFADLWDENVSLLNDRCAGEEITVVGKSTTNKGKGGKRFNSIEVLTVCGKGEGLPDLNELYNM